MESLISEYQISDYIDFKGWIDVEMKKDVFQQTDVLILPSYFEGLPISILEAMSYNKAVISTEIMGVKDIVINDESGFLFDPGDVTGLANAMKKYIESPELINNHGEKASSIIKNYYPENVAKQMEKIYESVLN